MQMKTYNECMKVSNNIMSEISELSYMTKELDSGMRKRVTKNLGEVQDRLDYVYTTMHKLLSDNTVAELKRLMLEKYGVIK